MATADVAPARTNDARPAKRRPFNWFRRLTNRNNDKSSNGTPLVHVKGKKGDKSKNNPYPESGFTKRATSQGSKSEGNLSYATPVSRPSGANGDSISYASLPQGDVSQDKDKERSNGSAAPTVATDAADTVHSDAGHSKAFTNTTGAGGLSSLTDGATGGGEGSTFSSPAQSAHSLTTTLTTIQSSNAGGQSHNAGPGGQSPQQQYSQHTQPSFSHQFPSSPVPSSSGIASAIPPHMQNSNTTYNQATANNLLTDNASILTLASSGKRRRRSMDTDASVRALAPGSMYGGSRESLPLSVLSGNTNDTPTASAPGTSAGIYTASQSRPSIGGLASAERASIYSSQGVTAPALASERNSYYAASKRQKERLADDAKSVSSTAGIYPKSEYDARSINFSDARSINEIRSGIDVPIGGKDYEPSLRGGQSIRGYEGSIRSPAIGHGRNDSIPGSIGGSLHSPMLRDGRQASTGGAISRRSSDFQDLMDKAQEEEESRDCGDSQTLEGSETQIGEEEHRPDEKEVTPTPIDTLAGK